MGTLDTQAEAVTGNCEGPRYPLLASGPWGCQSHHIRATRRTLAATRGLIPHRALLSNQRNSPSTVREGEILDSSPSKDGEPLLQEAAA
jgi:hypothetical protein